MKRKVLLGILIIFSLLSGIGTYSVDIMESRNFITAREMYLYNNWIIPTLNGKIRLEKPPIPTWITAGIMKLFHNDWNESLLRIPVIIMMILLIIYSYKFIKLMTNDKKKAEKAAYVTATTFMIIKISGRNTWDIYTYVFMFAAIYYIVKNFRDSSFKTVAKGGIFLSLSFLSKGPVAIYGMLIPFLISYKIIYKRKILKKSLNIFIVGIILSSIWPIYLCYHNEALIMNVFLKEVGTWTTKHIKSYFFYLDYFIFMGVWFIFSIFVYFVKKDKEIRFFNLWTLLTVFFLSMIKMKKERYGLPIYIISANSIGIYISYLMDKNEDNLKKIEKNLLKIQKIFLNIIIIFSLIILCWDFIKYGKRMNMLYLIMFLGGLFYFNLKGSKNKIIYMSGIVMLFFNCSVVKTIENRVRKNYSKEYPNLESLQKTKLKYNIYSDEIVMDDVWNVGNEIKKIDLNKNEKNIYYLTKNNLEENINEYRIVDKKIFNRFRNEKETINLYFLEKRE